MESDEKDEQKKNELLSVLCTNMSLAQMKIGADGDGYGKALTRAQEAMKHAEAIADEPVRRSRLSKACFRAGKAANALNKFELAHEFYARSLAERPTGEAKEALAENRRHAAEWKRKDVDMKKRMLGAFSGKGGESDKENVEVPKKADFEAVSLISRHLLFRFTHFLRDIQKSDSIAVGEAP